MQPEKRISDLEKQVEHLQRKLHIAESVVELLRSAIFGKKGTLEVGEEATSLLGKSRKLRADRDHPDRNRRMAL